MDKKRFLNYVEDFTRAEMEGRRQVPYAMKAFRAYVQGFESAWRRTFGMTIGTRESRKIVGRYSLTGEDVKFQSRLEDCIGIFSKFLDGAC